MLDGLSTILAQSASHLYGFEGKGALSVFVLGFCGLIAVAALVLKIRMMHWLIAGMLMASALTAAAKPDLTGWVETWLFPLQHRRAQMHLVFGVLLTGWLVFRGQTSLRNISFQSVFVLIVVLYQVPIHLAHSNLDGAFLTLGFVLAIVPCMVIAGGRIAESSDDCMQVIRTMMWVSVLWTFACAVQFVINPQNLLNHGGRFWGMLGNPNQVGQLCGPFAVFALWLLLNDTDRRAKILWIALIAINLLFVVWSGSRGGGATLVVGIAAVLYTRIGKAVLLLPGAMLMLWGLYELSEALHISENLERLTFRVGEDTRTEVWKAQFMAAMESPLIGHGVDSDGFSENSYLSGFATFGIGMFVILVVFLFASMYFCARLALGRRLLSRGDRALLDVFIAYNAMYFFAGMFEGSMLGRSNSMQSMMLMIAPLGIYVRNQIVAAREGALPVSEYGEEAGEHVEYGEHAEHGPAHPDDNGVRPLGA